MNKVKYENQIPKTLRNFCDKNADKVYAVGSGTGYSFDRNNGFAYDVLLRAGWKAYNDTVHTIIEATIKDTIDQIKEAKPCDCRECMEIIKG